MIFIIDDAVFSSPRAERLQLLSLFQLGFEGWHRVQTRPAFDPQAELSVNRWLAAQDLTTREEVELALELGLEADVHGSPSEITVEVGNVAKASWDSSVPRLPLAEALKLARRPLRLLVENRENDGAFLRMVAPRPWREHLLRAMEKGWLELEHGGGLPGMSGRVNGITRIDDGIRLWVLFDSDARLPDHPSRLSEVLRETCESKSVVHHRLRRRASENYFPLQAIAAWVELRPGNVRPALRRKHLALAAMEPERRHHYSMREGFGKKPLEGRLAEFWSKWATHPDLREGFGEEIRSLFHQKEFPVLEEWLRKDGQQVETIPMIQSIFRRL